jgi:DNA repair protein RadC
MRRVERKSMYNHYTMKELPESELPYEKYLQIGTAGLSDADLLAIILRCGSKKLSALQLAREVLCRKQKSLLNLHQMSVDELMDIPGIGKVKAIQLKCIAELSKRMAAMPYRKNIQLNRPDTIAAYYMEKLRHETKEELLIVMFDVKNHFLEDEVLSIGTVNASLVSPREIFLRALKSQAVNIILLHNHPSGDPGPSHEDIKATLQVAECGKMLGITLADHIIIGDHQYISFREKGMLN